MKKQALLGLLGLFLCGTAAPLAADNCQNWNNNCCEWSMCDGKFNVGADWLYWKTQQDCMNIGTVVEGNFENNKEGLYIHGKNKRPNYKYDSGFRVWAGYELPCDCWEIGVAYTYLPSSATLVSFTSPQEMVREVQDGAFFSTALSDFPILNLVGDEDVAQYTDYHAKWNTNLNYIDLDIARTVCLGECFKFRPHVGFRAAWLDQKLRANGGFPIFNEGEQPDAIYLSSTLLKEKFRGYGIEGGIWGDWSLGCGLSLVGHVGGSVLYSKFSLTTEQSIVVFEEGNENPFNFINVELKDSFWTGTPTVDYFLGLKYASCFCDMTFDVHAGWEQHIFFDMNRLGGGCGGNYSVQGLTLGLDVGF